MWAAQVQQIHVVTVTASCCAGRPVDGTAPPMYLRSLPDAHATLARVSQVQDVEVHGTAHGTAAAFGSWVPTQQSMPPQDTSGGSRYLVIIIAIAIFCHHVSPLLPSHPPLHSIPCSHTLFGNILTLPEPHLNPDSPVSRLARLTLGIRARGQNLCGALDWCSRKKW